ncbi:MAG: hypothetical protein HC887_01865 [Desulfobacteraceae bacterium]|nr:hypothetical protein [Desulfobacteraceae bacterium]
MKREMKKVLAMVGWAMIVLSLVSDAYAFQYTITDLGVSSGDNTWYRYAINNSGQIAGNSPAGAFLWENGQKTYIGEGWVSDINDSGQVSGSSSTEPSPFIWQNGLKTELSRGEAVGINNSGQVVGFSDSNIGSLLSTLWNRGETIDIGVLESDWRDYGYPPHSFTSGINDSGQVVGFSMVETFNEQYNAFLWENGLMKDLGEGYALGINNMGQVVGQSGYYRNNNNHALLWDNGSARDIGTLYGSGNSVALAINDSGYVVGNSFAPNGQITLMPEASGSYWWMPAHSVQTHAFIWNNDLGMVDLNSMLIPKNGNFFCNGHQ